MKSHRLRYQNGIALIISVLMLMGIGGFLMVGYNQGLLKQVEINKYKHNTRVLNEAKQALLQFAYNYPVTNGNGPGRLPCPDTDNSGVPDPADDCSDFIGRLPWNQSNLNLYDIRDADDQRLWYVVSDAFADNVGVAGNTINSDATGSITVRDQSGQVIYDGSVNGVAAVIIAPGDITARNGVTQDRSVANADDPFDTTADTDPGIINAANYLDRLVGTEDNANFTQDSPTDGFILGPVDIQSTNAINDQIIVITAAEVIEVAEKATLQAYRTAILNYLAPVVDGGTGGVYPWLYNYVDVPDIPGLGNYFPGDANFATELATNLDNVGRIPSIYDNYFTETDSQPIETRLDIAFTSRYPVSPATVGYDQLTPVVTSGSFQFADDVAHNFNFQTAGALTNVRFVDIPDTVGDDGRLTGTVTIPELITRVAFFWDDRDAPSGIWTLCEAGANQAADCNRDDDGDPEPGSNQSDNETPSWLLRVVAEVDISGTISFDTDYTDAPFVAAPTPANNLGHARISATYDGDDIIDGPYSIRYEIDRNYNIAFNIQETGLLETDDLDFNPLILGMRYYPELPEWVFDNGWQDSIMMAYAADYRPDTLANPCSEGTDCIQINNISGNNDDKISILVIASQHDWDDTGVLNDLSDDVDDVFDVGNEDLDRIFDARAVAGNDKILIIEEL